MGGVVATNTQSSHTGTCGQQQLELVFFVGKVAPGLLVHLCQVVQAKSGPVAKSLREAGLSLAVGGTFSQASQFLGPSEAVSWTAASGSLKKGPCVM